MKAFAHNRQIFILCLVPVLGFGIFSVANTSVRYLSTSAWISVLAAAVLILPAALMLCALAKRYPGQTLMEYAPKAVGVAAGKTLALLYSLFFLTFGGLLVSYFSHVVQAWILPHTDYRFVAAFICLICAYALTKDFTSIVRLISFIGVISVAAVLLIRILMVFEGDKNNLLPFVEPEVLLAGFYDAARRMFSFFFCVGLLAVVPQRKENKHTMLVVTLAILAAAVILILVCAACISILGVPQTALYKDAMVLAMKTFDISRATFIQRSDVIFIVTWTMLILCTICGVCYVPFTFIKTLEKKRQRGGVGVLVSVLLFVIAIVPSDYANALAIINWICPTFGVAALYGIPLILLIASGVRKHEKR